MRKKYLSPICRTISVFTLFLITSLIITTCSFDEAVPVNLQETVGTPKFSPAANVFNTDQSVSISTSTTGAVIHYTIDGTVPTNLSTEFTAPIAVAGNGTVMTIKAIAVKSGMADSAVAEASYIINYNAVSTPTFSPGSGKVTSGTIITISSATAGASFYYTTDGSIPVYPGNGTAGSTVTIDSSMTVKAIAYKAGMVDSGVASADYTLKHWVASGFGGTVIYSSNGGSAWASGNSGTTVNFFGIAHGGFGYYGATRIVSVGGAGTARYTYDGGINFYTGISGTTNVLRSVGHTNYSSGRFAAVGESGTVRISDNGSDWFSTSSGTTSYLYGISGDSSSSRFVAVGSSGTVIYSSNGGNTWTSAPSGTTKVLYGVTSGSGNTFIAVGLNGTIIYSNNGGATWLSGVSGTTNQLNGLVYDGNGRYIAVGQSGTVIYSTDSGSTWTAGSSETIRGLNDIAHDGNGRLIAVGSNGIVIYSDNGGVSWTTADSSVSGTLTGIVFE